MCELKFQLIRTDGGSANLTIDRHAQIDRQEVPVKQTRNSRIQSLMRVSRC